MKLYYYKPDLAISFPVRMSTSNPSTDWEEFTEETLNQYPGKRFYIDAKKKSIEARMNDTRELTSEMFLDDI